ncbi:Glutamyl-tRNA reductase [Methanimicrococcus hongohii]|uniref:Glutamyl-tRNA reductase n=1 Tax=Methanimicrococcus hongohii TaxID=3028295 RepID=A0AA96V3F0_9EURY|nr:glutamyl-tRNA reductase [Methanimicrococcus sp. Hf6]WNY24273.1 Glutamyl-tRNA reductase [Methanimicrococcus sp. Hf6]
MNEISSLVISHKKATVAEMECAWPLTTEEMLEKLFESELVYECVILKTCNRAEVYVVSEKGSSVLFNFSKAIGVETRIVDFHDHEESLEHLLKLACGLESMIVGEDQILGQIRDAYNLAVKKKTIGRVLDTVFTKAIHVGKRARTETRINEGSVSIGSAAVELAEDTLGGLDGKSIMVVGVGEIGVLVARALADKDLQGIYISNRTFQKAQELAYELGGEAILFDDILKYLESADVVISATGAPHYVITKKIVEEALPKRGGKPLFMVDIANPRDIEESVDELPGVTLCNIDNLRVISEKTLKMRNEEAKKVMEIIHEEQILLGKQYKRQKADDIIAALYRNVYDIREEEKQKAVNKFRVKHTIGEFEEKILENLTHTIANQILAEPTKILRNAAESDDEELLEAVARVFNIQLEEAEE